MAVLCKDCQHVESFGLWVLCLPLALLCWAVGVGIWQLHSTVSVEQEFTRHMRETPPQGRSIRSPLLPAALSTLFKYRNLPNHSTRYFPQIFNHSRWYFCINKNDQLISVKIFIVCKRPENKTVSWNSLFLWWSFCLEEGTLCIQAGHFSTRPQTRRAGLGRHGGSSHQGYTFSLIARSDASDSLSDVAWLIQTKTNALGFKKWKLKD